MRDLKHLIYFENLLQTTDNELIEHAKSEGILDQMQSLEKDENQQATRASRQREMEEWLDRQEMRFTEYEDSITRRFVEQITVVDADTIQVKIKDVDVVIDRKLC